MLEPGEKKEVDQSVKKGASISLPCNPQNKRSVPEASVSWVRRDSIEGTDDRQITEGPRILIDEQGIC